jgi:hypothetical protein
MLEKLTPVDIGILIAAAVTSLGAFCSIVHVPLVGSMNYVMGGRGDGIYILGCTTAIVGLVIAGYRRTAGMVAVGALFILVRDLVEFSAAMSKTQGDLAKKPGFAGELGSLIANSVGLEWGWILLVGGALAVIVLAVMAPGEVVAAVDGKRQRDHDEEEAESFSSADKKIADYLENRKISPAIRNQSTFQQTGFGKRRH